MKCISCGFESFNTEMCILQVARKPKGHPHRWHNFAYHCDNKKCEGIAIKKAKEKFNLSDDEIR